MTRHAALPGGRLIAAMSSAALVQAAAAAAAGLWATVVLGADSRGVMVIGLTTASVAALAGGFGTGASVRSQLPMLVGIERDRLIAGYTAVSAGGALLCALASVGVMRLCAVFISSDLGAVRLQIVVAMSAFVQCLTTQALDAWYAEGLFRIGSRINAVAASVSFVGVVVAGLVRETPTAMIAGGVAGELSVLSVSIALLVRRGLLRIQGVTRADVSGHIRRGWPTISLGFGMTIVFRADRFILGAFAGPAAITLYSLAATFSEVTRIVPHALGQVFIRQVADRERAVSLSPVVRSAIAATAASAVVVGIVGWVAIPIVFDSELHDARDYLLLLLAAELLFSPFFVASRGLMGGGWMRIAGLIGFAGCAAAVATYFVAVPPLGIVGACVASALTYLALSIATVVALSTRLQRRASERPVERTIGVDPVVDRW
jgi:O-antigen/teichoic acid export membrane protein